MHLVHNNPYAMINNTEYQIELAVIIVYTGPWSIILNFLVKEIIYDSFLPQQLNKNQLNSNTYSSNSLNNNMKRYV